MQLAGKHGLKRCHGVVKTVKTAARIILSGKRDAKLTGLQLLAHLRGIGLRSTLGAPGFAIAFNFAFGRRVRHGIA
jgi:hypothetical protein